METKTILLSEKEGKCYELWLRKELTANQILHDYLESELYDILFAGSASDFLNLPNKEEIAEKVVEYKIEYGKIRIYKGHNGRACNSALDSLLSAIGEYKYIIITESEHEKPN